MSVVEEQRIGIHITIVQMVFRHVLPQNLSLSLNHWYNTRLSTLTKEPYRVWLIFDSDGIHSKIGNLLYSGTCVIHERQYCQVSTTLAGRGIRLS